MENNINNVKFVNLTPHKVVLRTPKGEDIIVPPSGTIARVSTHEQKAGELAGVPLIKRSFGEGENLPERKDDTIYIVSSLVLSAVPADRTDVVAPDTGATAIRNSDGQIEAVTRLVLPS